MNYSYLTISSALVLLCLSCGSERDNSGSSAVNERQILDEMNAMQKANRENDEWVREGHNPDEACSAFLLKLSREDWKYPGWIDGVLPDAEWPLEVQNLGPLQVYRQGPNVVLMMALENGTERGYYLEMPPSSISPRSDEEWTFVPLGYSVWGYTRTKANRAELLTPARS